MDSMLLTAFTVGLLGGVHCIAMCGGVVGAFTLRRIDAPVPLSAQLAFNGGRIASYTLGGLLAGSAGSVFAMATLLPAQIMLFVVANGMLILLGLYVAGQGNAVLVIERIGARAWPAVRRLSRHLPATDTTGGRVAAGVIWGWTPCGLAYSMLTLALVSGSAWRGAAIMLLFGLGTLPNLLAAGWLLRRFGTHLKSPSTRLVAGLMIAAFGVAGLARSTDLARHISEGLLCLGGS